MTITTTTLRVFALPLLPALALAEPQSPNDVRLGPSGDATVLPSPQGDMSAEADRAGSGTEGGRAERDGASKAGEGAVAPDQVKASTKRLGDEAELALVVTLYDAGQYQACATRLKQLLDPEGREPLRVPTVVESARLYQGACLLGMGQPNQADEAFRDAIRQNPQIRTPDSLVFPVAVVERFLRVRERMVEEIRRAEQARMRKAEDEAAREELMREREQRQISLLLSLATRETVVEERSRWIAALPFGIGQFQNDNLGLGWTLLATELVLSAGFVTALFVDASLTSQSDDPRVDLPRLRAKQEDWRLVAGIAGWSLLGVSTLGVLEAQIAFVPSVSRERYRPLPQRLGSAAPNAPRDMVGAGRSDSTPGVVLCGRF